MENPFNTKINIEITLGQLEDIIVALRVINKYSTGSVRRELEEKLSDIAMITKSSI